MRGKPLARLTIPNNCAVLAYLAGIIDGEGSIGISSHRGGGPGTRRPFKCYIVVVQIANTSEALIAWLVKTLGGGGAVKLTLRRPLTYRQAYRWQVYGNNADALLKAVLPYLVIKKPQAELVIALRQGKPRFSRWTPADVRTAAETRAESLKQQMHKLNKRGPLTEGVIH